MYNTRRRRTLEVGVLLILYEVMRLGFHNIPPVTLLTLSSQALLYTGYIDVPWEKRDVCISAHQVLHNKDWKRLVLSSFEHGDDMHLYYNMASFLIKGRTLEKMYGSKNFAVLLLLLLLLTNLIYVAIGQSLTELTGDGSYQLSCAIGFSGVIFALKVLITSEKTEERAHVGGITMPGKYAAWAELILIHFFAPNSSFMGHLSGILAGLIYCKSHVRGIVDNFISQLTGEAFHHSDTSFSEPNARSRGSFNPTSEETSSSQGYAWNDSAFESYGHFDQTRWDGFGGNRNYGWNDNLFSRRDFR